MLPNTNISKEQLNIFIAKGSLVEVVNPIKETEIVFFSKKENKWFDHRGINISSEFNVNVDDDTPTAIIDLDDSLCYQ